MSRVKVTEIRGAFAFEGASYGPFQANGATPFVEVPAALASLTAILGSLALVAGILALVAPSIIDQSAQLGDKATEGIQRVQTWIKGPPLNVQDDQLDAVVAPTS